MITQTSPTDTSEITFAVTGMTCASCVRRIEKALGKVDGVHEASVNLATEKARVLYDGQLASPDKLQAAVQKAGYGIRDLPVGAPARQESAATGAAGDVVLPIEGMTCASCVRRIEKALGRVEGVSQATVNLATEKAHVTYHASVASLDQLQAAVERAGYKIGVGAPAVAAKAPTSQATAEDAQERERQLEFDGLRRKWTVSLVAGALMMALAYIPLNVPMDVLAPLLLIAATVVQFWAGRPIYAAAWAAARHGSTNMNTLIAVGTSVAYGYSAFVTLWPRLALTWGFPNHLYFETAVIIIALILLGRWLEARARSRLARPSRR